MSRPRKNALFELGDQWIGRISGSATLYRFWFDQRNGRTSRASLGTEDIEEAKLKLATLVLKGGKQSANGMLATILEKYFVGRTDKLPSKQAARAAGRLLLGCWGATCRANEFTEAKQKEFVDWSIAKGHSLSYISRNLSVLAAAFSHSKIPHEIVYEPRALREKWVVSPKPTRQRFIPSDEELDRFLSYKLPENLWRWTLIQLATGGRPQTAIDLAPKMRIRENGTVDLNMPGRAQNKKFRAKVREPEILTTWLDRWEREARKASSDGSLDPSWRYCGYASLESVQTAIERVRAEPEVNLPRLSTYSFRHKVTTILRRAKHSHGVTEDDISTQLGHRRPHLRMTGDYGEWDPEYLKNAAAAIDAWFIDMQRRVKNRNLLTQGFSKSAPIQRRERVTWRTKPLKKMVGATGIEPVTPTMSR